MKYNKKLKKGFTLVELVVVIAVIAILAAVSVGAYFGVTESANRSADEQAVAQMNKMLETYEILTGRVDDVEEAKQIFEDNGLTNITPFYGKNTFYWTYKDARVIIWDESKGVTYPSWAVESYKEYSETTTISGDWYDLNADKTTVEVEGDINALISGINSTNENNAIQLKENNPLILNRTDYNNLWNSITSSSSSRVVVDFNNNELTFNGDNFNGTSINDKNVVFENGNFTFSEPNLNINNHSNIFNVGEKGSLTLRNMNITVDNAWSYIFAGGPIAEIIIEDSVLTGSLYYGIGTNNQESSYINITIRNSKIDAGLPVFSNVNSQILIEGSTLEAWQAAIALRTGIADVYSSVLYNNDTTYTDNSDYYYEYFGENYGQFMSGNAFPTAISLLGNYSEGYEGDVIVNFERTTFKSEDKVHVPDLLLAACPGTNVRVKYSNCSIDESNIVMFQPIESKRIQNNTATISLNGTVYNYPLA